jgi:hypothetical protein
MKTYAEQKPLGTAKFEPIRAVRYLDDEDVFELEFDSGDTFRVSHAAIRRANGLAPLAADVDSVWIDADMRAGFLIRYRSGEWADCSWDFVRESPNPKV